MNYAQIRDMDIVNGEGIAVSLFVQGCSHHCFGCFNQSTWDFQGGERWTDEVEDKFIELCKRNYVSCVSILGGEPFEQWHLDALLRRIKEEVRKPIWVWTGYLITDDQVMKRHSEALRYIDYLVDGKFEQDKIDMNLRLRGSSNQRIWHIENIDYTNGIKNVTEEKGWKK